MIRCVFDEGMFKLMRAILNFLWMVEFRFRFVRACCFLMLALMIVCFDYCVISEHAEFLLGVGSINCVKIVQTFLGVSKNKFFGDVQKFCFTRGRVWLKSNF